MNTVGSIALSVMICANSSAVETLNKLKGSLTSIDRAEEKHLHDQGDRVAVADGPVAGGDRGHEKAHIDFAAG